MRLDSRAKHNLINITSDDTAIYRLLEVHHLFELFEKNLLVLVAPKLWDDPYDDFLNHCYGVDPRKPDTRLIYNDYSEYIFGQCWTLNIDKDSTWRIYSPNKNKVKIKTTVNKLYSYLNKIDQKWFKSYIGKVSYLSESEINENISESIMKNKIHYTSIIPDFYFKKRDTFQDENEVRLMVRLHKEEKYSNAIFQNPENHDICELPIKNPLDLIEEVVFDPRMPNSLVRAYKNHLRNSFGFKGNCEKSTIYDSPQLKVEVKNIF